MSLGKILGSISPAFGMISGKGAFGNAGGILGSLSPLMGMLLGKGMFGNMGGGGQNHNITPHEDEPQPQTGGGMSQPGHLAPQYIDQLLQSLIGR